MTWCEQRTGDDHGLYFLEYDVITAILFRTCTEYLCLHKQQQIGPGAFLKDLFDLLETLAFANNADNKPNSLKPPSIQNLSASSLLCVLPSAALSLQPSSPLLQHLESQLPWVGR